MRLDAPAGSGAALRLIDSRGRIVREACGAKSVTLDIRNTSAGVYLVTGAAAGLHREQVLTIARQPGIAAGGTVRAG